MSVGGASDALFDDGDLLCSVQGAAAGFHTSDVATCGECCHRRRRRRPAAGAARSYTAASS